MSLLVRKINIAKWRNFAESTDVGADAITSCLRTTGNTLSVWKIETEADLDKAVLAIVANQERLDKIDIVILNENSLTEYNLSLVASKGITPIESLIDTHRDIAELTYSKLGQVKDHIVERLRDKQTKMYTVNSLKKLFQEAIAQGVLNRDSLKESLRSAIPLPSEPANP